MNKAKIENISIKNSSVKLDTEKYWMLVKDDNLFEQVTKLGKGANVIYSFGWDAAVKKRVLKSIAADKPVIRQGVVTGFKPIIDNSKSYEVESITPTKEAKQGIETLPQLLDALKNPNNEINFFLEQAKDSAIVWNNMKLIIEVLKLRARL